MTSKEVRKVIIYSMYKYLLKNNMLNIYLKTILDFQPREEERKLLKRDIRKYLFKYAFRTVTRTDRTLEEHLFLYRTIEGMVSYIERNIEEYKKMKYDKTRYNNQRKQNTKNKGSSIL